LYREVIQRDYNQGGRGCTRREFVKRGAAFALALGFASARIAQPTPANKTRLILLGTGGGPRPRKNVCASAQVIIVNELAYVIDCGNGVANQLARAGVPLTSLRHVFITHHHSDHNADYGNLLLLAWASGLQHPVNTWGPSPLKQITQLFLEMNAVDIEARISDEGRTPLQPLIHAHEITEGEKIAADENVTVSCALVDHPPMKQAFAFRFDSADRSIVISGDTRPCDALVTLAKGADVLVHEALYLPAVDRIAARVTNAKSLKQSIINHHTSAEDAGRIAKAAGVKTLVLSHLVPADDDSVTDQMWIEAARRAFTGRIIVGKDLMEI
jgi:ribonuclease BN (tRNA processing enzyme)